MPELIQTIRECQKSEGEEIQKVIDYVKESMIIQISEEQLATVAALKVAMTKLASRYGCQAVAIQCWNALQSELGIMPCER
jgi:uncharacterized protein YpuA (DUF1002 family)